MRQCTKIFLPGFLRSKVRNCANVLSFGNGHRQGSGTYCMPRRVTILRSLSREPRRSTTMLIPIFARVRKPSLEGWPPRYRVVVAAPKFGRFLRIDLFWLECWADEEEVVAPCTSPGVDNVAARIAKQLTGRVIWFRACNFLCPTISTG